jgi:regulatory protein
MPDDHSGDLSWLTDWVTDQRARTPAEPLINPWAGDGDEAPPGTHPASQPSDPDVAPKAGRDAENHPGPTMPKAQPALSEAASPQGSPPSRSRPRTSAEAEVQPDAAEHFGADQCGSGAKLAELRGLVAEVETRPEPVAGPASKQSQVPAESRGQGGDAERRSPSEPAQPRVSAEPRHTATDAAARIAELRGLMASVESQPVAETPKAETPKAQRRSRRQAADESGDTVAGLRGRAGAISAEPKARGDRAARPERRRRPEPPESQADELHDALTPEGEQKPRRRSDRREAGEKTQRSVDDRDPAARAKDICLSLLTARPRTRSELKKALVKKEISEEVAEQVLGRLDDVGLIDDKAFAEMYVRARHAYQGMGKRALSIELRRKGVDNDTTAEAVAAVDEEAEEERARQLVRKRLPSMSNADHQAKIRRLVGMLARKGYSQGLAYRVVKDELANVGEETSLLDNPE